MTQKENYLLIDHRAGPGMPQEVVERTGLPLISGRMVELKTYTCPHCTQQMIVNPWRQREREYCRGCNATICDSCAAIARRPDYVHRTWQEVVDLVAGGYAALVGGTHGEPQLIFFNNGVNNG